MQNSKMFQSTTLVTALSVLERGLGFLYRIVLARLIGAEGMGLYQLALSVFAVFLTACSSGVPVTLSRLISKYRTKGDIRSERETVSSALLVTLFSAGVVLLLLILGHGWPFMFSDDRARSVFFILLLGFLFDCAYSVVRGSFWGNKQFVAYSFIEFVEEVVMVVVGVALLSHFGADSAEGGARLAAFAVVVSYIGSFVLSTVYFFVKGGKFASPIPQLRPLLSSALPITAMRTSTSLVSSFVAILLPARLIAGGMSRSEAMSAYGVTLGMAMPVLFTPATVIGSIALVLTPYLSESYYKKAHNEVRLQVEKTLSVCSLVACFFVPYFFVFGEDMGVILFESVESGAVISRFAFMLLPLAVNMIVTSVLNSMNMEKYTLAFFFVGAVSLLASVWFLTPVFGVYAMPLGQAIDFTVSGVLGLILLRKKCVEKPRFIKGLLLPALFSALLCALFSALYPLVKNALGLFLSIGVTGTAILAVQAGYFWTFYKETGFLGKKIAKSTNNGVFSLTTDGN